VVARTRLVFTEKEAFVFPAGTVTVAAIVTLDELALKATAAPPAGAGAVRMTVPRTALPPTTAEGVTVKEESAAWEAPTLRMARGLSVNRGVDAVVAVAGVGQCSDR